jgi:transposase
MTLHPYSIGPVFEETAQTVHAACPKGNHSLHMRDQPDTVSDDQLCAALFSPQGQAACTPWHLTLVSIMQFAEGVSDWQAAEAVHMHIDWKYALHGELNHPGFDFFALSECRARLLAWHAEQLLFETSAKLMGSAKCVGPNIPF